MRLLFLELPITVYSVYFSDSENPMLFKIIYLG
jgi:hypothetical protein